MTDSAELEDLEGLVHHPGWLRYRDRLKAWWDDDVADRVKDAASQSDDAMAIHKLRQALAARDAVLSALRWPDERLAQIRRLQTHETVSLSRGGL